MPRKKTKRNNRLVDETELSEENSTEHLSVNRHQGGDTRTQLLDNGRFRLTSDDIRKLVGGNVPSHTTTNALSTINRPSTLNPQTNEHEVVQNGRNELGVEETMQPTQDEQLTSHNTGSAACEPSKKKGRGPTYMSKIWGRPSCLPKIELTVDENFNIISGKSQFTEFLGSLARNSIYCPLVKEAWSEVESKYKDGILEVIKQRFNLPPELTKWTIQSVGKKWRTWKAELKATYYDMSLPVSEAKYHKDVRVDEGQWNELWAYWGSDEAKKLSNHCKLARQSKKMNHTTGKKSFAAIRDKMTKENGRTPTRVEMFDKVYSHSDGRPSNNVVAEKLGEMKEKLSELPSDYEDVVSRDDVFSQVMGKDNPGYVRLYGEGVHPNDAWSKNPSRNKLVLDNIRQQTKLKNLEEKLEEQAATIARMQAHIQGRNDSNELLESSRNISISSNTIASTRSAGSSNQFRVGREVLIKSFLDAKKIVARGYIRSMDPLSIVHGYQLGPKWFEVEVKAAIDGNERLIRPFYHLETIQDALGANIAWPEHLISVYVDE